MLFSTCEKKPNFNIFWGIFITFFYQLSYLPIFEISSDFPHHRFITHLVFVGDSSITADLSIPFDDCESSTSFTYVYASVYQQNV